MTPPNAPAPVTVRTNSSRTTLLIRARRARPAGSLSMDDVLVPVHSGGRTQWFQMRPLDVAIATSLPADAIVGLLVRDRVVWTHAEGLSPDPFDLQLREVSAWDVIVADVRIELPAHVLAQGTQHLNTVPVEGPAATIPWRFTVGDDAIGDRSQLTVGDLCLPLFCETIGLPLNHVVFERRALHVAREENSQSTPMTDKRYRDGAACTF